MNEYAILLAVLGALGIYLWARWAHAGHGGCPGHGADAAGSDGGRSEGPKADYAVDPVCGMKVARLGALHTTEHEGQAYVFCSTACKMTFDVEPERYVGTGAAQAGREL